MNNLIKKSLLIVLGLLGQVSLAGNFDEGIMKVSKFDTKGVDLNSVISPYDISGGNFDDALGHISDSYIASAPVSAPASTLDLTSLVAPDLTSLSASNSTTVPTYLPAPVKLKTDTAVVSNNGYFDRIKQLVSDNSDTAKKAVCVVAGAAALYVGYRTFSSWKQKRCEDQQKMDEIRKTASDPETIFPTSAESEEKFKENFWFFNFGKKYYEYPDEIIKRKADFINMVNQGIQNRTVYHEMKNTQNHNIDKFSFKGTEDCFEVLSKIKASIELEKTKLDNDLQYLSEKLSLSKDAIISGILVNCLKSVDNLYALVSIDKKSEQDIGAYLQKTYNRTEITDLFLKILIKYARLIAIIDERNGEQALVELGAINQLHGTEMAVRIQRIEQKKALLSSKKQAEAVEPNDVQRLAKAEKDFAKAQQEQAIQQRQQKTVSAWSNSSWKNAYFPYAKALLGW